MLVMLGVRRMMNRCHRMTRPVMRLRHRLRRRCLMRWWRLLQMKNQNHLIPLRICRDYNDDIFGCRNCLRPTPAHNTMCQTKQRSKLFCTLSFLSFFLGGHTPHTINIVQRFCLSILKRFFYSGVDWLIFLYFYLIFCRRLCIIWARTLCEEHSRSVKFVSK